MDLTIHLSESEVNFLREVINEHRLISPRKEFTIEDAIHECIRDAMFDEGEKSAKEEFE